MKPTQTQIEELWTTAQSWLSLGYSVVPCYGSKKRPSISSWRDYQSRFIEPSQLWEGFSRADDPALAVICGQVSGNLECIDVDIKHNPEGVTYLIAIRDLYPDLAARLRVEGTPSEGFHILYRVAVPFSVPGNKKLAVKKGQKEAWLETRGEGGLVLIPPSPGYKLLSESPEIPTITADQRNALIGLAESMDERTKIVEKEAPQKKKSKNIYSLNPWDDFAQSPEAEGILLRHGWEHYRSVEGGRYIYFTRPGKDSGVSASFNRDTRIYYIFTSSTELEPSKGYTPGTLACILEHGGDTSAMHRWLTDNGYGRLEPKYERAAVRKAVMEGKPIPANISDEGKKAFEQERKMFEGRYPYGIFWEGDMQEGFSVNPHLVLVVADRLGFRHYRGEVCDISNPPFVKMIDERYFFDSIKSYIQEDTAEVAVMLYAALERFFKHYGSYIMRRLPLLDESALLRSERFISRKAFANGVVEVTASGIQLIPFADIIQQGKLIWKRDVIDRDYRPEAGTMGIFQDFIDKATVRKSENMAIIGYLCHEYKDATMAYIIPMTEEVEDPKEGGGVGKNLLTGMLGHFTTVREVPGEQVSFDAAFYQPWNGERIYALSDLPEKFPWNFLKNLSSNSASIKKLWKNIDTIEESELPKLLLSTNYSYQGNDGGLRRRIIPIEFTEYFRLKGGVDAEYNKLFPNDFDDQDWATFDNYILLCIRKFLEQKKLTAPTLTETGWAKQFKYDYSLHIYEFISLNIQRYISTGFIAAEDFTEDYEKFCNDQGVHPRYRVSRQRMNDALADYCRKLNITFDRRAVGKKGLQRCRGLLFGPLNPGEEADEEVPF